MSITGFFNDQAEQQQQYERLLADHISAESIKTTSEDLSQRPSLVGTTGNQESLNKAFNQLTQAGLEPYVESYDIYMSVPKEISVIKTKPNYIQLKVMEDVPTNTPFANEIVPGYHAYSPPGDVEAELVYANYGRPEDFEELERHNISVDGKIVITRYGENFRGVKPKQAAARGAIGMLIYSDPIDDGYTQGAVYPNGPWKPSDGIERGSVLDLSQYPGDPLTPGKPSKQGVERLTPEEAESLPSIPTTPISSEQASLLLKSLQGEEVPESWQGALPFLYHFGSGETKVRISLNIDYERRPVRNIIASIPGSKYPGEKVILGAHRDAWTYGADDNMSAWASLMECARVLSELYYKGWQPERTIIIAGWDGEEYGLLGSTEWAEDYLSDLTKNAVANINLERLYGQFFSVSAVPSMHDLIYAVAKEVTDPRSGTSIYDDWVTRSEQQPPSIGQLGSGSDYTPFLQHIGMSTLSMGFNAPDGLYHTAYDNSYSIKHFMDPEYQHHAAGARLFGIMALRLANANILPLCFSKYAATVEELLKAFASDYTLGIDLTKVINQAKAWKHVSEILEQRIHSLTKNKNQVNIKTISDINQALLQQERDLTHEKGLPDRPWYKHQIWAPGLDTGYAAQPLPALAQTLDAGDKKAFEKAVNVLEQSLSDATRTAHSVAFN